MKRLFAVLLSIFLLLSLAGCNRISINHRGNATLNYCGKVRGNDIELSQALTAEETSSVKKYLTSARYCHDGAGCPFDENISIAFGDQIFAVATDDCPTVWIVGSDDYYTISDAGRSYIISLFQKYIAS